MIKKIRMVYSNYISDNGEVVTARDFGMATREEVRKDKKNLKPYPHSKPLGSFWILDDCSPVNFTPSLQQNLSINVLEDRSGVLVIHDVNEEVTDCPFLPPPNNAAVFNADGSLRFVLQNPLTSVPGELNFFRADSVKKENGEYGLGICIAVARGQGLECFHVDGTTPDLTTVIRFSKPNI
ncbi:hypothetical protein QF117_02290 [Vibrio sp. YMD68]|uniref:hypothetical protein n=1 Tax=Vibrio sp. YMD68 TaxID=3042300 RepID=UPI00249BC39C|nr:hypothetical protein [Vibrio sp. YMD68]WGV98811.1 hypothetical protein QF117_02290 [Vibrio sp. YMD68]